MAMEETRVEQALAKERTLVALVPTLSEVVAVVRQLHEAGFTTNQISLLAKDQAAVRQTVLEVGAQDATNTGMADSMAEATEPKGRDEMAGMAIGGAVGFLIGLSAVAIPGFGAFLLAAGPVAIALNALTVSAAGMGMGALLGAIFDEKITEDARDLYNKRLESGWWMLLVHADDAMLERATDILHRAHVEHVETV